MKKMLFILFVLGALVAASDMNAAFYRGVSDLTRGGLLSLRRQAPWRTRPYSTFKRSLERKMEKNWYAVKAMSDAEIRAGIFLGLVKSMAKTGAIGGTGYYLGKRSAGMAARPEEIPE